MANPSLFRSLVGKLSPKTDTQNAAGAPAYALSAKHALAQYAATGCLNRTYYASADEQLDKVQMFANAVEPQFVAKTAVFCRERGAMKDMPALLCALLSVNHPALCAATFPRVNDDAKMLRTFVQIIRSGAVGRKSLGTRPKRLVTAWLDARSEDQLFRASVGQSPSLGDVIKLVHPKPETDARRAFYGYMLGREHNAAHLPELVTAFEDIKAGRRNALPNVPFQMLTALNLSAEQWTEIAKNASWQTTRMNLNTFARHGVFAQSGMDTLIAERLRDANTIRTARAFPYQLLAAYRAAGNDVPNLVKEALQDAMEVATSNVPTMNGKIYVLVDVSGSMSSPITGHRRGSSTKIRCIDGAALVAAAILRKNPAAEVIPFENRAVKGIALNPRDTVITNADKLASLGGGGTNLSAPLSWLNERRAKGDMIVFLSDNESWIGARRGSTAVMTEWAAFKQHNPKARMACIDFVPNSTTQAKDQDDVLNIGGFSDTVFDLLSTFSKGEIAPNHWVAEIEKISL